MTRSNDISLHEKQITWLQDQQITLQLTLLKDSIYVYVGSPTNNFASLALSTLSRIPQQASSTTLISTGVDDISEQMAKKMSLKYKRQVLFAFNGEYDDAYVKFCEVELVKFINECLVVNKE